MENTKKGTKILVPYKRTTKVKTKVRPDVKKVKELKK